MSYAIYSAGRSVQDFVSLNTFGIIALTRSDPMPANFGQVKN